jgi:hypothetical protein
MQSKLVLKPVLSLSWVLRFSAVVEAVKTTSHKAEELTIQKFQTLSVQ